MANRLNPNSIFYSHEQEHNKRPHFAVFLGAGASIDSGISSANRMIEDFIEIICDNDCPEIEEDEKKIEWLVVNNYYKTDRDKYSSLFEKCYPKEVDRREYIESQVDGKVPSLGYIALAHLIRKKIVDTIITTNFDDLVYIACTSYTDTRPVVYSLGGFASEISGTTDRPRVLKLHGDFLFSDIKTTTQGLKEQDPNMAQQVQQILESCRGLVVIGYSGNDDSIINLLSSLSKGKYLYWCVYKDEKVNKEVENLLKEKEGWIVRHEGFDKLLNEIREIIGIKNDDIFDLFGIRRIRLEEEVGKFNPKEFEEFSEAFEIFIEAGKYFDKGDYNKAAKLYGTAIELYPDYARAYNRLGLTLDKLKYPQIEVAQKFDKAIKLKPDYAYAYNNLGFLYTKDKSKYKEAEECFRRAIDLDDTYDEAHNNLGYLLDKIGSHQGEAEGLFREAIRLNPDNVEAYNNLGILLDRIGFRREEAEQVFRKAIETSPENVNSYVNLGRLLAKDSSRFEEAEKVFRNVINIDKKNFDAFLNLGILFSRISLTYKVRLAEKILKKCVEIKPNSYKVRYYLGILLSNISGREDDAEQIFRGLIKDFPKVSQPYESLSDLLQKNFLLTEKSEQILRDLIREMPNYSQGYVSLAYVLLKNNSRYSEAETILRETSLKFPKNSRLLSNFAFVIGLDDSRLGHAEQVYQQVIEIEPKYPKSHNYLGILYYVKGQHYEAKTEFKKALESDNGSVTALLSLAALSKKSGDSINFDEYLLKLKSAIDYTELYDLAGLDSLYGNTDSAIEKLRSAIEKEPYKLPWAKRFPCFESIRNDPRFKELIGRC